MGSHGGDYRPFGYDLNEVHGIGLPNFNVPGPPPQGPGILSDQEQEQMQNFFHRFDDSGLPGANIMPQYHHDMSPMQGMEMPQTYVGHETSLRSPHGWQEMQMNNFQFNSNSNNQMNHMQPGPPQNPSYSQQNLPMHPLSQMYADPAQYDQLSQAWQPHFVQHHVPVRPDMNFGTDPNFQNGSYTGPTMANSRMTISDLNLEVSHTAPNSQPNTQPSSPIVTKKRKHDDYRVEKIKRRNSSIHNAQSETLISPSHGHQKRKSHIKNERPPTPLSKPTSVNDYDIDADADEDADADADFDEDAEPGTSRTQSPPAPWPSSKAPPLKKDRPPITSKDKGKRKPSASANAAARARSRPSRTSSSSNLQSRVPLTVEQKKANHTNSEQRRRDATARAYAELYDLVPEVSEMGKQSTMKKLEVVVDKVRKVQARRDMLRAVLGINIPSGYGSGVAQMQATSSQMRGWQ